MTIEELERELQGEVDALHRARRERDRVIAEADDVPPKDAGARFRITSAVGVVKRAEERVELCRAKIRQAYADKKPK